VAHQRGRRRCGEGPDLSAISAYFAMGGYAVYVWPAYSLTAMVLGGLAFYSWRGFRASVRGLEKLQRQVSPRR
jgi:heme exporter protein D